MYRHNAEVSSAVDRIAREACRSLFEAYGIELVPTDAATEMTGDAWPYCGILGFTGPTLRGSVLLASSRGAFERSCPVQGTMRDWVGELTNQLVGRLKARLVERGIPLALSTPVVLHGEHFAPLPRPSVLAPSAFLSPAGMVLVWTDVEVSDEFDANLQLDGEPAAEEVEALFF
jgi:CheY-specific phosphatase CheX